MLNQLILIYFIIFVLFLFLSIGTAIRYQQELIKRMRAKGIKDRIYDSEEYLDMFIKHPSLFIKVFYSSPFRYIKMLFKKHKDVQIQELVSKIRGRILITILLPIIYFIVSIVTMAIYAQK